MVCLGHGFVTRDFTWLRGEFSLAVCSDEDRSRELSPSKIHSRKDDLQKLGERSGNHEWMYSVNSRSAFNSYHIREITDLQSINKSVNQ